ncbi:hypothetical protein BG003_011799, partial [Podila horticola]
MTDTDLTLFCLVDGDATSNAFPIRIPSNDTVDDLKNLIKARNNNAFSDIDADKLTLWRVSLPVVTANRNKPIILTEIESTTVLDPTDEISDIFEDQLPKKTVNVIIQRPLQGPSSKRKRFENYTLMGAIKEAGLMEKAGVDGRYDLSLLNNEERVSLLGFIGQEIDRMDTFDSLSTTALALQGANIEDMDRFSAPPGHALPVVQTNNLYVRQAFKDLYDTILGTFEDGRSFDPGFWKRIVVTDSSPDPNLPRAKTIISASPRTLSSNSQDYKDINKRVTWWYYMAPWNLEELKTCRGCVKAFQVVPLKMLEELYSETGGVPRYVLETPMMVLERNPRDLKGAKIAACRRLEIALKSVK